MAKIIGGSDCTGNIKFNFQRYGIKNVKSFDEIKAFTNNYQINNNSKKEIGQLLEPNKQPFPF